MTDHSSLQKEKNNTDIVERLPPCPLCGGEKGYSLHEGATYRWWDVQSYLQALDTRSVKLIEPQGGIDGFQRLVR